MRSPLLTALHEGDSEIFTWLLDRYASVVDPGSPGLLDLSYKPPSSSDFDVPPRPAAVAAVGAVVGAVVGFEETPAGVASAAGSSDSDEPVPPSAFKFPRPITVQPWPKEAEFPSYRRKAGDTSWGLRRDDLTAAAAKAAANTGEIEVVSGPWPATLGTEVVRHLILQNNKGYLLYEALRRGACPTSLFAHLLNLGADERARGVIGWRGYGSPTESTLIEREQKLRRHCHGNEGAEEPLGLTLFDTLPVGRLLMRQACSIVFDARRGEALALDVRRRRLKERSHGAGKQQDDDEEEENELQKKKEQWLLEAQRRCQALFGYYRTERPPFPDDERWAEELLVTSGFCDVPTPSQALLDWEAANGGNKQPQHIDVHRWMQQPSEEEKDEEDSARSLMQEAQCEFRLRTQIAKLVAAVLDASREAAWRRREALVTMKWREALGKPMEQQDDDENEGEKEETGADDEEYDKTAD